MSAMERKVRYEICARKIPGDTTQKYSPYRLPRGGFAEIFLAEEVVYEEQVDQAGHIHERVSQRRPLVAKVFSVPKDRSQEELTNAYEAERDLLIDRRCVERLVGLYAEQDNRPPTFFCCSCGKSFSVLKCMCGHALLKGGPPGFPTTSHRDLVCSGPQESHHIQDSEARRRELAKKNRPCDCVDPLIDVINFSFTHCLFLERLHIDLVSLNELLRDPDDVRQDQATPSVRLRTSEQGGKVSDGIFKYKIQTMSSRKKDPQGWVRETCLIAIQCLIEVAEALEYLHRNDQIHGDLSPGNIMMILVDPASEGLEQRHRVRLIDFGVTRKWRDTRATTTTIGPVDFHAPEVRRVKDQLDDLAWIERGETDETSYVWTVKPLGEGDFLSGGGGSFAVLGEAQPPSSLEAVSTSQRKPTQRRIGEKRYRLQWIDGAKEVRQRVRIHWNQAVRIPADIYSFGCIAMWLISAANEELLDIVRKAADTATSSTMSKGLTIEQVVRANTDLVLKMKQAILQPSDDIECPAMDSPEDEEVRDLLVRVILRCLIRGKDAYAETRSDGYRASGAQIAKDLRSVHDLLFLNARVRDNFVEKLTAREERARKAETELALLKKELARRLALPKHFMVPAFIISLAIVTGGVLYLNNIGAIRLTRPPQLANPTQDFWGLDMWQAFHESEKKPPPAPPHCAELQAYVEGGTFDWRSTSPENRRSTNVEKGVIVDAFCIDRTEVTVAKFRKWSDQKKIRLRNAFPRISDIKTQGCNLEIEDSGQVVNCMHPLVAKQYCEDEGGNLPTEIQWSFVAGKGKEALKFPWGDSRAPGPFCIARYWPMPCSGSGFDIDRVEGSDGKAIHGMFGNVAEWVLFIDRKSKNPAKDRYALKGASYIDRESYILNSYDYLGPFEEKPGSIDGGIANGVGFAGFRCVHATVKDPTIYGGAPQAVPPATGKP